MNWANLPDFSEIGRSFARIGTELQAVGQRIQRFADEPVRQLRQIREDRDSANAQLNHLRTLPLRTRRKAERLAAYCPRGCQVVTVYATSGRLLLELRGNVLITGKTPMIHLPDASTRYRPGTHLPHRGYWVTDEMHDPRSRWSAVCRHAAYPVSGATLLTALPATGCAGVEISVLAPTAC